jgi:hypothetical protein
MACHGWSCLASVRAGALRIWWTPLLLLAAAFSQSLPANGAESTFDPRNLQLEFGTARDLKLINRVADIPADGRDKLDHFAAYGMLEPGIALADIGMDWSHSDARVENRPWGQHRFSGVSESLLAIVFVTSTGNAQYRVILAPRHSADYCLFGIENLGDFYLSLSTVQNLLRPDRDQTVSRTPTCVRASIGKPFQ